MNRILQPAFYEFRGHRSDDPTPWGSGFEQSDFIDNHYTLSGLDLVFLGSENDFVRIGMTSNMVNYVSRSPVLLMKKLFDRYDCARAIRFTSYLPSGSRRIFHPAYRLGVSTISYRYATGCFGIWETKGRSKRIAAP